MYWEVNSTRLRLASLALTHFFLFGDGTLADCRYTLQHSSAFEIQRSNAVSRQHYHRCITMIASGHSATPAPFQPLPDDVAQDADILCASEGRVRFVMVSTSRCRRPSHSRIRLTGIQWYPLVNFRARYIA